MYRILTEYVNPEQLVRVRGLLIENKIDYTLYHAEGSFKGIPEQTIIIELSSDQALYKIRDIAKMIGEVGHQKVILVQYIAATSHFISLQGEENGTREESVLLR